MDAKKKFLLTLGIGIILIIAFFLVTRSISIFTGHSITSSTITGGLILNTEDNLAKCLTEKGAKMYGAYTCSHCQNQKNLFGEDFKYINYIECSEDGENANPSLCQQQEINTYPTWQINNQNYIGEKTLEQLKQLSGC